MWIHAHWWEPKPYSTFCSSFFNFPSRNDLKVIKLICNRKFLPILTIISLKYNKNLKLNLPSDVINESKIDKIWIIFALLEKY